MLDLVTQRLAKSRHEKHGGGRKAFEMSAAFGWPLGQRFVHGVADHGHHRYDIV
jgi:hypothetical protein